MAGEMTIEIDEDGAVQVSVKGVAGKSCKDVTKAIEAALGKATETKTTREYSAPESKSAQLKARG